MAATKELPRPGEVWGHPNHPKNWEFVRDVYGPLPEGVVVTNRFGGELLPMRRSFAEWARHVSDSGSVRISHATPTEPKENPLLDMIRRNGPDIKAAARHMGMLAELLGVVLEQAPAKPMGVATDTQFVGRVVGRASDGKLVAVEDFVPGPQPGKVDVVAKDDWTEPTKTGETWGEHGPKVGEVWGMSVNKPSTFEKIVEVNPTFVLSTEDLSSEPAPTRPKLFRTIAGWRKYVTSGAVCIMPKYERAKP